MSACPVALVFRLAKICRGPWSAAIEVSVVTARSSPQLSERYGALCVKAGWVFDIRLFEPQPVVTNAERARMGSFI